jgi:peptidoglycan hydrolase-like protein with peptidoglycan-binding domain
MTQLSSSSIISEIQNCESAVYRATGRYPVKLFRPPYGDYNSSVLNAVGSAGYPYTIMWTIDTLDWAGTASDTMVQKVLNNAEPGAIVLMHVGSGTNTLDALPRIIENLKSRGYRFTTLTNMLSLPQVPTHPLLKSGSTGSEVRYLQESLAKLGYNPGPIDGIFGPQTDKAVRAFQADKGLVVDGIVGNNTWAALEKALENPPTPPTPPTPPPSSSHPLLRTGSTGSEVRYLQESLIKLGYNPGSVDGIFGPQTEQAVRAFQSNKGLAVDGIVGNNTWAAIENALGNPPTPPTPPPSSSHPLLRNGSTGSEVRYLQEALKKLGYDPGPIDGIFGSQTEKVVRSFQANKGLVVDGIVGNNTWAALENALKSASASSYIHADPDTKKITIDPLNEAVLKVLVKFIKILPKGIQNSLNKILDIIDPKK